MSAINFFDTLTDLPLFKGISHETMARTVGRYRFEFKKFVEGETIIEAGSPCASIVFVLSGKVRMKTVIADFEIGQTLSEGSVFMADFLYGRITKFPSSVVASETVGTLEISKADYINILNSDNIFLLNYLNYLSRKAQLCFDNVPNGSFLSKISYLIDFFTQPSSSDIQIRTSSKIFDVLGLSETDYNLNMENLVAKKMISSFTGNQINIKSL